MRRCQGRRGRRGSEGVAPLARTAMTRTGEILFALAALSAAGASGQAAADAPPRFPNQAVWNQDVSQAALHPQSASMIATLAGLGGFGYGRMQIDFGMRIVNAPIGAPTRSIVGYPSNAQYYAPDCEPVGTAMPVPVTAAIEASAGLSCANASDDCHLLVVQGNTLYEAYRANASGAGGLQAQCLAVWKLDQVYPASNRGDHCTSADAAGFPIAPLLFNADEVYAGTQVPGGDLGHAIRFILPNASMASLSGTKYYVRPASHAGGPSGPSGSVPYGSRLRLRANFPVNLYSPAAQVILRTMQHYGIVLSDGGNIALTAEADLYTTHTWSSLGIGSRTFDQQVAGTPVRIQDFEVIDTGPRIVETYACVRNPDPAGTPTVSIGDASVAEGNSGVGMAVFPVTLSAASAVAVTVDVATSDGSAFAGSDYAATTIAALIIPAGATSANFSVPVFGDATVEADETFLVALANPNGATLAAGAAPGAPRAQGIGRIGNDDLATLSIGDTTLAEGNSGKRSAFVQISLSAPMPTPVTFTVSSTTPSGTATAGLDYIAATQSNRVMDAGRTTQWFAVDILGDTLVEADETFQVTLAGIVGALPGTATGTITIVDDDGAGQSSLSIACGIGKAGRCRPGIRRADTLHGRQR